jgi:hypothetical protein
MKPSGYYYAESILTFSKSRCGETKSFTYKGKTVTAKLLDSCDGCPEGQWNLGHDAFYDLVGGEEMSEELGVVQVDVESGGSGDAPEGQEDCSFTTSCGKICCSAVSCALVKSGVDAGILDHCGVECPAHNTSCGKKCCSAVSCGLVAQEVRDGKRDECGHYVKIVDEEDCDEEDEDPYYIKDDEDCDEEEDDFHVKKLEEEDCEEEGEDSKYTDKEKEIKTAAKKPATKEKEIEEVEVKKAIAKKEAAAAKEVLIVGQDEILATTPAELQESGADSMAVLSFAVIFGLVVLL